MSQTTGNTVIEGSCEVLTETMVGPCVEPDGHQTGRPSSNRQAAKSAGRTSEWGVGPASVVASMAALAVGVVALLIAVVLGVVSNDTGPGSPVLVHNPGTPYVSVEPL